MMYGILLTFWWKKSASYEHTECLLYILVTSRSSTLAGTPPWKPTMKLACTDT